MFPVYGFFGVYDLLLSIVVCRDNAILVMWDVINAVCGLLLKLNLLNNHKHANIILNCCSYGNMLFSTNAPFTIGKITSELTV